MIISQYLAGREYADPARKEHLRHIVFTRINGCLVRG
jgi:hypothetical protein